MLSRRANGFTLIEMAVTMSVFAILVAIGVPSMRTWIYNVRIRTVSDALQNGLRLAQAESLRQSRQVVFALTNSPASTTTAIPLPATVNGTSWAIYTLPSMTDGSENPNFIASGILSSASSNVLINSNGAAAVCFNSTGHVIGNASASLTSVTGGATCVPPAGVPPLQIFNVTTTGANADTRQLEVQVNLGGQVHMCDPAFVLSLNNPEGC
jgi:type IV fimbrial biogenesis protein FimT